MASWVVATGCVDHAAAVDYGDPTAATTETTEDGIVAYFVTPASQAASDAPSSAVEIVAYTAAGDALDVRVGTGATDAALAAASGKPGKGQRFAATVPLLSGSNAIDVTIATHDGAHFRRLRSVIAYAGAAPGIAFRVLAPAADDGSCSVTKAITGGILGGSTVCVSGQTTAGASAVTGVALALGTSMTSLKPDGSGRFLGTLTAAADQKATIHGTVTDGAGRHTSADVTVIDDQQPPALALTAPSGPGPFFADGDTITLSGTASDANGLASLRIRTTTGGTSTIALSSPWTVTVPLDAGSNQLTVVATDVAGNVANLPVTVSRSRVIVLHGPEANQGKTQLLLDREALGSLFSVPDQQNLTMAAVPMRPSVVAALHQIRDPEQNGVDTSSWGTPEHNMNRLLNMTPDNADLKGSSVEALLGIAEAVGLPPADVLAQLVSTSVTTSFVDLDKAADVILAQLIGTHPNITKDAQGNPTLTISLYDVFQDLHPLAARFGPSGAHPGFLAGTTESKVLQPGFRMSLPVKSNLTKFDGVDASADDRAALFVGGTGDALTLDFGSSDFSIVGLTDEPTVDLDLVMKEDPTFLKAGTVQLAGPDAQNPGFYRGNSPVWDSPPWVIEHIVAETAYRENAQLYAPSYLNTLKYDAGSIKNAAQMSWDHGWVTITTAGGIGSPPAPQYVWDILLETAQLRLHDGGLAEGTANLGFALKNVGIGLTADDLVTKVKPTLQSQSSKLSALIAGSSGLAASSCDFYLVTGGPAPYLFFRAAGDATGTFGYASPGFFADAALSKKVSSTAADASTPDTTHEKLVPTAGQVLYFKDDGGAVYRLDVDAVDAGSVTLRVSPVAP